MQKKLNLWYRRRKNSLAYRILRDEAERHSAAGHNMEFLAINDTWLTMHCFNCPDPLTTYHKER